MSDIIWFLEVLKGSLGSVASVAIIVIPLMVIIEFAKHFKIIDKIAPVFVPVLKLWGLPKEAVYPLVAGMIFGISYGAGVIIQSAKEGFLTKRHLFTINLFLVICHSIIEDTMLFVALGAKVGIIVGVRFMLAVIITSLWHVLSSNKFKSDQKNMETLVN